MEKLVRLFLVLLIGVALVGCREDKKDDDSSSDRPTASASDGDDESGDDEGDSEGTDDNGDDGADSSDEGDDDGDDGDDGASIDGELESFHYVVTIDMEIQEGEDGISGVIEGDYVSPDRHSFTQEYGIAGLELSESYVIIGDDAWTREGSGSWQMTTASDFEVVDSSDLTSADPDFFAFDDEFAGDLSVLKGEDDVKNGIEATRVDIDFGQLQELGDLFNEDILAGADAEGIEDLVMKVWLTRDERQIIAVDMDIEFSPDALGSDFPFEVPPGGSLNMKMTFDLTQINDDSITVEPPI